MLCTDLIEFSLEVRHHNGHEASGHPNGSGQKK